jgi:hypothetical protein
MILSVLSGELPVSDAIEQAQISRQLYYDLEERALNAMLVAMTPGAETLAASPQARIAELEDQCKKLEQHKRRSERLLALTRQVLKPGSVKAARGRPRKKRASAGSTHRGSKPLQASTKSPSSSSSPVEAHSTPTKDGEAVR